MRQFLLLGLLLSTGVTAQVAPRQGDRQAEDIEQPAIRAETVPATGPSVPTGRVARSSAGEVGQRQTREDSENVPPMARINNRIANRVQSRLRTRIDRNYDLQANTTSPFAVASDEAREAGRPRRR